jgi:hypothetical protein
MGLLDAAWVKTSNKKFKTWTQAVAKAVKDPESAGRPLVILELGSDPKIRKQTDLLHKQTKLNGTILIRVNPQGLKVKSGSEQEDETIITIMEDCQSAVEKIDNAIHSIM